jgi:hypothetical protein
MDRQKPGDVPLGVRVGVGKKFVTRLDITHPGIHHLNVETSWGWQESRNGDWKKGGEGTEHRPKGEFEISK